VPWSSTFVGSVRQCAGPSRACNQTIKASVAAEDAVQYRQSDAVSCSVRLDTPVWLAVQ